MANKRLIDYIEEEIKCEYAFGNCMYAGISCIENPKPIHKCLIRDEKRLEDNFMKIIQMNKKPFNSLRDKLKEVLTK